MKPATQIILTGAFATIILAVLLVIIWFNRDTDRTSGILVKAVVAPLVVAAALLAAEILSPLPGVKAEIPVVIFRKYNAQLVPVFQPLALSGDLSRGEIPALFTTYREWLVHNPPPAAPKAIASGDNKEVMERGEFFLDLFEVSFWQWLSRHYDLPGVFSAGGSKASPEAGARYLWLATPRRIQELSHLSTSSGVFPETHCCSHLTRLRSARSPSHKVLRSTLIEIGHCDEFRSETGICKSRLPLSWLAAASLVRLHWRTKLRRAFQVAPSGRTTFKPPSIAGLVIFYAGLRSRVSNASGSTS